jgi:GT2 family glycosyltransferase
MSVVIVTPDRYETIRKTIAHIRDQGVRDHLEIVIVAPSARGLDLDGADLRDFVRVQVVETGPMRSRAEAVAEGVRQARAPIVVLAEDHAYPEPGWAEALIKAHREPWAAVGPVLLNANPNSAVSWADLLIGYASWLDPVPGGVTDRVPGHNSSYKRAVLMEYGSDLVPMLLSEIVLHWDLRTRGYQLYLEPSAKVRHLNFERLSSMLKAQFNHGRAFASVRVRGWPWSRRMLYAGGSPLIPLIRFWRILRGRGAGWYFPPLRVLPALMLGLVAATTGELLGYAFGAGAAEEKLIPYEFHRVQYLDNQREPLSTH